MKKKTSYFGHLLKNDSGMQTTLVTGYVEGEKERERQRLTWMDNIKEWAGGVYQDVLRKAHTRPKLAIHDG